VKNSGLQKNAAALPGPVFEVRENQVCAELGVSKDELRRRRQYFLVEGQHWGIVNKKVLLSRVGAEILRGTREAEVPGRPDVRTSAGDAGAKRAVVGLLLERNPRPVEFAGRLIVWGMPGHNRRVVVCYVPGTDPTNPMNLVTLSVRDNGNFMKGMEVPPVVKPGQAGSGVTVVKVKEREDRFELLGQCPRWKGRW
jgi:hypothetical protein